MDSRDRRLELIKLTYSHHLGAGEAIGRADTLAKWVEDARAPTDELSAKADTPAPRKQRPA